MILLPNIGVLAVLTTKRPLLVSILKICLYRQSNYLGGLSFVRQTLGPTVPSHFPIHAYPSDRIPRVLGLLSHENNAPAVARALTICAAPTHIIDPP